MRRKNELKRVHIPSEIIYCIEHFKIFSSYFKRIITAVVPTVQNPNYGPLVSIMFLLFELGKYVNQREQY